MYIPLECVRKYGCGSKGAATYVLEGLELVKSVTWVSAARFSRALALPQEKRDDTAVSNVTSVVKRAMASMNMRDQHVLEKVVKTMQERDDEKLPGKLSDNYVYSYVPYVALRGGTYRQCVAASV